MTPKQHDQFGPFGPIFEVNGLDWLVAHFDFFNYPGCQIFILCKIYPKAWKNQSGQFVKLCGEQFRMLEKLERKLEKRVFTNLGSVDMKWLKLNDMDPEL